MWVVLNNECSEIIKKVIEYKNKFPFNCTSNLPASRQCSQINFDLVVSGGDNENTRQVLKDAFTVDFTDFSNVKSLPTTNYGRYKPKIICIKGKIYEFGGFVDDINPVMSVEKCSLDTNTWDVI